MACPNCGAEVSEKAVYCPACHANPQDLKSKPRPATKKWPIWKIVGAVVSLLVIGSCVSAITRGSSSTTSAPKPAASDGQVAAKPTQAPQPTQAAKPTQATAVPKAVPVGDITATFRPSTLRVGERVTFTITLTSANDVAVRDVWIRLGGAWDKVTVVSTEPGRIDTGLFNIRNLVLPGAMDPGGTRTIAIVASPNEPGNHEFTFSPYYEQTQQLKRPNGEHPILTAKLAVTR